ncbi:hypothetical protein [Muricoccus radiodurans]|uniref:hypothetical protein n=1 Tax=Muricoccus radiodurans TaxID=2231721 RepID=UPI003CE716DD
MRVRRQLTIRIDRDHHGFDTGCCGSLAGEGPGTNIVLLGSPPGVSTADTAVALRAAGVLAFPLDWPTVRFVDVRINDSAVARAVELATRNLNAARETAA